MSRDSDLVVLATVKAVEPYRGTWDSPGWQNVHYRLDEIISNDRHTEVDIRSFRHGVTKGSFSANPFEPGLSRELFAPGRQLLLFIRIPPLQGRVLGLPESSDVQPQRLDAEESPYCGVMPADPEVLQHVRAEVARALGFP
jgi:hypothetical protein